ncbi:MAG: hypothetical protein ABI746_02530 [Dermatophilaceae bacterium]
MKARISSVGVAAAMATAALALTGCAGAVPGAAAEVNGSVIRESSVTAILDDVNSQRQGPPLDASNVVQAMILNEIVATSPGVVLPVVSADEARSVIQKSPTSAGGGLGVQEPSQPLVEFMRVSIAVDKADAAKTLTREKLTALVKDAKVTVNPRYGSGFDGQQGLVNTPPNWFVTEGATGGALTPGQPQPAPPPETLPAPAPPPETLPAPAPTAP